MKEQFVTYEIALLLKKLGFNDECFGFYYHESHYANRNKAFKDVLSLDSWHPKGCLYAPLWQQADKFIRQKTGKLLTIRGVSEIYPRQKFLGYATSVTGEKKYRSYEKAQAASILAVLKALIKK